MKKHNTNNTNESAAIIPILANALPSVQNARAKKPQIYTGEAAFSLREFMGLDKLVGRLDYDATDNVGMERNDSAIISVAKRIDSLIARTEAFSDAAAKFHAIYNCAVRTWDAYRNALNNGAESDIIASASIAWDKAFTALSVLINAFKASWDNLKKYYMLAGEYKTKRNEYIRLLTDGKDLDAINAAGKAQAAVRADIGRSKVAFLTTWHDFLSLDIREIA